MIRYVATWAAIGMLVPLILFLLDRLAGALINAFPLGLLFLAWPTSFMMWMVSLDWFGVGIIALSVASNSALYAGVGRIVWALRHRARH